jgi:hypothetical protein
MAGTLKRISGPAYLAAAAADIYTPPAATIYTVIKQIRVANKTGVAATFTLYIGATGGSAGGTEITGLSKSVAANDFLDMFFSPGLKMISSDFLTGLASAATTLTITVMGEQVVV